METFIEMKKRHEAEIAQLQENCPHGKSSWMPFSWAPGHFAGDVLVCEFCGKILEHRHGHTSAPVGQITTGGA